MAYEQTKTVGTVKLNPTQDDRGFSRDVNELGQFSQLSRLPSAIELGAPNTIKKVGAIDSSKCIALSDLVRTTHDGRAYPNETGIKRNLFGRFFCEWAAETSDVMHTPEAVCDLVNMYSHALLDEAERLEINVAEFPIYRKGIVYACRTWKTYPDVAWSCLTGMAVKLTHLDVVPMMKQTCKVDDFCNKYSTCDVRIYLADIPMIDDGEILLQPRKVMSRSAPRYIAVVRSDSDSGLDWIKQVRCAMAETDSDSVKHMDYWYHGDSQMMFKHINLGFKHVGIKLRIAQRTVEVDYLTLDYLVSLLARVRRIYNGAVRYGDLELPNVGFGPRPAWSVQRRIARGDPGLHGLWQFGLLLMFEPVLSNISVTNAPGIGWGQYMDDRRLWPFLVNDVWKLVGDRCYALYEVIPHGNKHPDAPLLSWYYFDTGVSAPSASLMLTASSEAPVVPSDTAILAVARYVPCLKPILAEDDITMLTVVTNGLLSDPTFTRYNRTNVSQDWVRGNQFTEIVQHAIMLC
jgi:hypothetical protein